MLRRLAAAALFAVATVAPASAAIITYNVSTTTANFQGGSSLGFADGPTALALNATFTIDTSQGGDVYGLPLVFGFNQSGTSPFITTSVSDNGFGLPAGMLAGLAPTGESNASRVTYDGTQVYARSVESPYIFDGNGDPIGVFRSLHMLNLPGGGPAFTVGAMNFPIPQVGDLIHLSLEYNPIYFGNAQPQTGFQFRIDAYGIFGAQASDSFSTQTEGPTDAPEPASLALLGLGLAGMAVRQRRRVAA